MTDARNTLDHSTPRSAASAEDPESAVTQPAPASVSAAGPTYVLPESLLSDDLTLLEAAQALAAAGLRVLPLTSQPTGNKPGEDASKNPGGLLGRGWQNKSTTDPEVIEKWFTEPDTTTLESVVTQTDIYRWVPFDTLGLGVHAGPDILIVDADNAQNIPERFWDELEDAPFQSSSTIDHRRGHYYFRPRQGFHFGHTSAIPGIDGMDSAGEIRHGNAIAVSAPSKHFWASLGRAYRWKRVGTIPEMSEELAQWLESRKDKVAWNGTDIEVAEATLDSISYFRENCTNASHPEIVDEHVDFMRMQADMIGLHNAWLPSLIDLIQMSLCGYVNAADAIDAAGDAFVALRSDDTRGGNWKNEDEAQREYIDLLKWALGKVQAKNASQPEMLRYDTETYVREHYATELPMTNLPPLQASVLGVGPAIVMTGTGVGDSAGSELATTSNAAPAEMEAQQLLIEAALARFPTVDLDVLMSDPPEPLVWLEENIIARGSYVGLTAAAKAGKSILTYWMAGHWAMGRSAIDPTVTFEPPTILYLDFENGTRWMHSTLTKMGFASKGISEHLKILAYPTFHPLNTREGAQELHAVIAGINPDVIVIDTVSRIIDGDENDSKPWSDFYRLAIMPIRDAYPDATIIRLDHTGKDPKQGARGSSQKMSDIDTHWVLTAEAGNRNNLTLDLERSRLGEHAESVQLRRVDSPLGHVLNAGKSGTGAIAWGPIHAVSSEVEAVNIALDELDAPDDISNAKAKALLKAHGQNVNSEKVRQALVLRKGRSETVPDETPKALE
ncbi:MULTISPECIES: AAA family ATPase [unclassified Rhodococcus (in: high G+C Gram-positive bacteria)]|uniref:AAA family ATPase n=1 Tax=unclassified Rhodococcus (in: high G+C Gram-positive bacteria) TaxID=192944 RepID=UPI00096A7BDA|nr:MULTISPECIES: AAA family ATPase [unclassified Rhodococcus (in: high G+C Gram-positive bacteria)]